MVYTEQCKYFILHETTVDENLAMEKRKVIKENVTSANGVNLFTVTYQQVLQDFGVRNWNGRTYSRDIVMNAINRNPIIQHDIHKGTWCGEYGHPLIEKGVKELERQMTIYPPLACNTINRYWEEGNLLLGECTTLADGMGNMLRDRILTNFPAMASSRAIGGVDRNGNVLPGYTVVTFDTVIRPSHKTAYQVAGSEKVNMFGVPTGQSMTETAAEVDITKSQSFADFILSENSSKQQIGMLCDTFHLDYDSMSINENTVRFSRFDGKEKTTVVIPIRQLVGAEYHNLF